MQLALLQLHQSIAAHMTPQPPALPSPLLMSPSALSALLTPSGSGFRVDFGAALTAMQNGTADVAAEELLDPLDVSLSPLLQGLGPASSKRPGGLSLPSAPRSTKRFKSDTSWADGLLEDSLLTDSPRGGSPRLKGFKPASDSAAAQPADAAASSMPAPPAPPAPPKGGPARKGLVRPGGSLSVDVSGAAGAGGTGPNQLSQASLSQAPLSALLSAFGFGSGGFGSPRFDAALGLGSGLGSAKGLPPPQSAMQLDAASPQLLGFSPDSLAAFMGSSTSLLEAALDAPLSSNPISHSRRSPRLLDV